MGSGNSKVEATSHPQDEGSPADFLICGGGIVGLTLAMALKRHTGITAEVYEKTNTFATEAGAGLGMYPNGLRVLRDISPELLAAVRAAGHPYTKRCWERHDGTCVMTADEGLLTEDQADLEPLGIRRSKLQKVLYHYAQFQGIHVNFEKPLKTAFQRESDDLIEVTFGDGTTRLTRVLFGADGALGTSRILVAGEGAPKLEYTGVTCLMGLSKVKTEGIHFPSSNVDEFHAVLFPTGPSESCFQFHVPVSAADANQLNWGNLSQQVGRRECRKIAKQLRQQGWHEKYIHPLEDANLVQAVRVGFCLLERPLDTWVNGNMVLVGDAAHPPV
jgi:salicylate hydroxylase